LGLVEPFFPLLLLPICLFKMKESSQRPGEQTNLINATEEGTSGQGSGWSGLFKLSRIKQTSMGIVLAATLQLTGINAVMYFGPNIIKKAGFDNPVLLNIIVGGWNFLTTFIAALLVDRLGRRPLVIGGTFIMSVALVGVGLSFALAKTPFVTGIGVGICLLIFIAGFEAGVGCLFWVLVNEIFDERVRDAGSSMANVLQWGFNLVVSSLFQLFFNEVGQSITFYIFGGIGVVCSIYMAIALPETKKGFVPQ